MHPLLLIGALLSAAAPVETRVAVMPLVAGQGISAAEAQTLSSLVVSECRRQKNLRVISQDEIAQVLTLEQQRQLLGCGDNDRCRIELGGALGAERMVMGNL